MDIFIENYNYENSKQWLMDYESLLLKCVFVYIVTIFSLKFVMANRKPFDLQMPLIIWNGLLAVFSIAGFIRITPTFISAIMNKGITHTYTEIGELQKDPNAGYWAFAWCVSKIPELIDTLFVVLRKRPLMFMHWYHHALTGYFAFVTFYEENAYMVWVVWLNYFIHSFMYSYYCARAIRIRVPPQLAQLLTFAQICQFMITHAVMGHLLWLCYSNTNKVYAVTKRGFSIGAFMEVTYILLWFRFYYISYIANGGKKYTQHRIATQNGKIQQKIE